MLCYAVLCHATAGAFGTGVATGRVRTDDIAEVPSLDDVDCATFSRGGEAVEDDGMGIA